jgi:hypothetical protein
MKRIQTLPQKPQYPHYPGFRRYCGFCGTRREVRMTDHPVITGNRTLAARARQIADAASAQRRTALVVAVALDETRTPAAARKVLDDHLGQGDVYAAALELLDDLTTQE